MYACNRIRNEDRLKDNFLHGDLWLRAACHKDTCPKKQHRNGVYMKYIVDGEQMKLIDRYTIEQIGIPAMVLMEKSANAIVQAMLDKITKRDKILAVCGTGNNGGDGVAAARLLKEQGFDVAVLILGDEKRATEQMKTQLFIARNLGLEVFNNVKLKEYTVIIDAIFGIGLSKMVEGIFKSTIDAINMGDFLVYAVDIPSGIHAGTGKVMNVAVNADVTVTFGLYKKGIIFYPGCDYAGEIIIADIGFPIKSIEKIHSNTFIYDKSDLDKLPNRMNNSNKGHYGRVLVIAGSKNMCGACYLSSKAAYRAGAGIVKILTVEENRSILQSILPEAILSTYNPVEMKNKLETERILKELEWATAIVIGPGMGITTSAERLIEFVLENVTVPVVIDADALNILAQKEKHMYLEDGKKKMKFPKNVILTPHLKEMSRLLDCDINAITENIMYTAINAVKEDTFHLVLKDARSVVTDGKRIYINTSGNHGMATGGSGDVLTGIIVGFLAQGLNYFEAASLGVYIHGMAADYAVKGKSCYSLIASDIIEAMPYVLR